MIGKQTKGTSFGGCVRYVLKEEKSKLLEAVGVEGTPEQMAEQFELHRITQRQGKKYCRTHFTQLLTGRQCKIKVR